MERSERVDRPPPICYKGPLCGVKGQIFKPFAKLALSESKAARSATSLRHGTGGRSYTGNEPGTPETSPVPIEPGAANWNGPSTGLDGRDWSDGIGRQK